MIELHPEIPYKNGKKEFAVLTYEEFVALQEFLEDIDDLWTLREAKESESAEPAISLEEVKLQLGL